MKQNIIRQLKESSRVLESAADLAPEIAEAAALMIAALKKGHKIISFGNGGSAADALNFAAELVGRYARNRPPLDALALTVNPSNITAIANDFGYEEVFSRQLEAHGKAGDVAIAISTSGNSPNVLRAAASARRLKIPVIGLTGKDGGKLKAAADLCVKVPSDTIARIQEAHIAILQIWASLIEDAFYPCHLPPPPGGEPFRARGGK
ncbi:MAG: SIS domain-containing protein [Elusimicrobia bacterium]|nr:SIS domain-containing protein [Elusimicrobiota bacterium]MBI5882158.1 SIS domain-containing protein [Elusimicrobiota bacterium]